ncbi:MAG: type II toxin-antitoxin system HicB family antitoxin [Chloroflexota bacterium]|nr:type II toxin-antitoxin system HicB family antitoxin [Chloroflexota bacterium]
MATIDDYLWLPYQLNITLDADGGGYGVAVVELSGCMTFAPPWDAIRPDVRAAMESWIGIALKHSDSIPEPLLIGAR